MQTCLSPFAQSIPFIILDACEYHNTDEEGLPKILVKSANFPEKNEPLFSHQIHASDRHPVPLRGLGPLNQPEITAVRNSSLGNARGVTAIHQVAGGTSRTISFLDAVID